MNATLEQVKTAVTAELDKEQEAYKSYPTENGTWVKVQIRALMEDRRGLGEENTAMIYGLPDHIEGKAYFDFNLCTGMTLD